MGKLSQCDEMYGEALATARDANDMRTEVDVVQGRAWLEQAAGRARRQRRGQVGGAGVAIGEGPVVVDVTVGDCGTAGSSSNIPDNSRKTLKKI